VSAESADRLTRAYGTRADHVLDIVQRQPELGARILEGRPHILAEAIYAVTNELALHVEDVLFRRTRLGLETRDGTREAAERVARVMATELGWPQERSAQEVEMATNSRAADDRAINEAST